MTIFGTLSPTLTFKLKMQTWLEVRKQLVADEQKKGNGRTAIERTDVDELITEILGKENPSLLSIVGGIDSGNNIQASEHTLDA